MRFLRISVFISREDESGALWRLGALFETAFRVRVGAAGKEYPTWLSGFAGVDIKIHLCIAFFQTFLFPLPPLLEMGERTLGPLEFLPVDDVLKVPFIRRNGDMEHFMKHDALHRKAGDVGTIVEPGDGDEILTPAVSIRKRGLIGSGPVAVPSYIRGQFPVKIRFVEALEYFL